MNYEKLHDDIISRSIGRTYDSSIHHLHHIIPRHEDPNSTECAILTHKEHRIIHLLRYKMGKPIGNKIAYCFMKGTALKFTADDLFFICSNAGKKGGRTTKDNNLGIFSLEWDRAAQNKLNWDNGLMDHINFVEIGKIAGAACRDKQKGIHDPNLQHLRREWAIIGSNALIASGNFGGYVSKEWRERNQEQISIATSKGGKNGGKVTGKMFWWNNGIINTRSLTCPGEEWVRGMLMSEKKYNQVMTSFAGNNKKETK
jgi:hypothetical protein